MTSRPQREIVDAQAETAEARVWSAKIREGEVGAFEAVFHHYGEPLYRFVYGYVRSDIARDLVQDVFLRLWRDREQLEPQTSLRTRLYVAARSRALDYLRHERVAGRLPDVPAPTTAPGADEAMEHAEQMRTVRAAIETLPPRAKQVFVLYWAHEMSYREIAEVLGVTTKTVEHQLARAMQAVRQLVLR